MAQLIKNPPPCRRPQFDSWVGKSPWRRDSYLLQYSWAVPVIQLVKNLPEFGRTGFDPWRRSPGEGKVYPLQYSGLENCRVAKCQMWLSLHSSFWFRLFNPMRQPKTLHSFSATAFRISNNFRWKDNGKYHAGYAVITPFDTVETAS